MRSIVALIILIPLIAYAEPTFLVGKVTKVRDGDTIEVGNIPIRLNGVSTPEMNEPLGSNPRHSWSIQSWASECAAS